MILHQGTLDHWREKELISANGRRLLGALASGEPVSVPDLVDAVYGHRPDGGPNWAESSVRVLIWRTQKNLGGRIRIETGKSYSLTLLE